MKSRHLTSFNKSSGSKVAWRCGVAGGVAAAVVVIFFLNISVHPRMADPVWASSFKIAPILIALTYWLLNFVCFAIAERFSKPSSRDETA